MHFCLLTFVGTLNVIGLGTSPLILTPGIKVISSGSDQVSSDRVYHPYAYGQL